LELSDRDLFNLYMFKTSLLKRLQKPMLIQKLYAGPEEWQFSGIA
jgi:hypothetical protein